MTVVVQSNYKFNSIYFDKKEKWKMKNIKTKTSIKTKNILAISMLAIICLILSFTVFIDKAMAVSTNNIDFIIATTDLRESNHYNNDPANPNFIESIDGKYIQPIIK